MTASATRDQSPSQPAGCDCPSDRAGGVLVLAEVDQRTGSRWAAQEDANTGTPGRGRHCSDPSTTVIPQRATRTPASGAKSHATPAVGQVVEVATLRLCFSPRVFQAIPTSPMPEQKHPFDFAVPLIRLPNATREPTPPDLSNPGRQPHLTALRLAQGRRPCSESATPEHRRALGPGEDSDTRPVGRALALTLLVLSYHSVDAGARRLVRHEWYVA